MNRIRLRTLTCPPIVTLLSVKAAVDSFTLSTTDPRLSTLDLLIISYSTFIKGLCLHHWFLKLKPLRKPLGSLLLNWLQKPLVSLLLNWLLKPLVSLLLNWLLKPLVSLLLNWLLKPLVSLLLNWLLKPLVSLLLNWLLKPLVSLLLNWLLKPLVSLLLNWLLKPLVSLLLNWLLKPLVSLLEHQSLRVLRQITPLWNSMTDRTNYQNLSQTPTSSHCSTGNHSIEMLPFGVFVLYRFQLINDSPSLFINTHGSPDLHKWEFMQLCDSHWISRFNSYFFPF